jgi:hypothetical protein
LRQGLANFLPQLTWSHDPFNLCLPSICDYNCKLSHLPMFSTSFALIMCVVFLNNVV